MEVWETSEKREIQERLETHQVVEATAQIVEHTPEAELRMTLGSTSVKGLLSDRREVVEFCYFMYPFTRTSILPTSQMSIDNLIDCRALSIKKILFKRFVNEKHKQQMYDMLPKRIGSKSFHGV